MIFTPTAAGRTVFDAMREVFLQSCRRYTFHADRIVRLSIDAFLSFKRQINRCIAKKNYRREKIMKREEKGESESSLQKTFQKECFSRTNSILSRGPVPK